MWLVVIFAILILLFGLRAALGMAWEMLLPFIAFFGILGVFGLYFMLAEHFKLTTGETILLWIVLGLVVILLLGQLGTSNVPNLSPREYP